MMSWLSIVDQFVWHFVCTQMSYMSLNPQSYPKSCFSYGWKTARAVVPLFEYGVWVGWGGAITFMLLAISSDATLVLRHGLGFGLWVGWGGAMPFMLLAITFIIPTPQWWKLRRKILNLWSGKPPPESALRVHASGALKCVLTMQEWSQKHLGDRRCPILP